MVSNPVHVSSPTHRYPAPEAVPRTSNGSFQMDRWEHPLFCRMRVYKMFSSRSSIRRYTSQSALALDHARMRDPTDGSPAFLRRRRSGGGDPKASRSHPFPGTVRRSLPGGDEQVRPFLSYRWDWLALLPDRWDWLALLPDRWDWPRRPGRNNRTMPMRGPVYR